MSDVAPWLVLLRRTPLVLSSTFQRVWNHNSAILMRSEADFEELRRHLRRFLRARLPDGRKALFRFYDPRVLRAFLSASSRDEIIELHGPIFSFLIEGANGTAVVTENRARPKRHRNSGWLGFQLSHEHLRAFDRVAMDQFSERINLVVQSVYPTRTSTLDTGDLKLWCDSVIQRAIIHDITNESEIALLALILFLDPNQFQTATRQAVDIILEHGRSTGEKRELLRNLFKTGDIRLAIGSSAHQDKKE